MKHARLPPRHHEAAFVAAVMAYIGREIRAELRRILRRRHRQAPDTRTMIARLEAAGHGGAEPVPGYEELHRAAPMNLLPVKQAPMISGTRNRQATPEPRPPLDRADFVGRPQIAWIMGVSTDWLYRNLARLKRDDGFPLEEPGDGRERWNRMAVETWSAAWRASGKDALARRARARSLARSGARP